MHVLIGIFKFTGICSVKDMGSEMLIITFFVSLPCLSWRVCHHQVIYSFSHSVRILKGLPLLIRGGSIRLFNSITASFDEHSWTLIHQINKDVILHHKQQQKCSLPLHQLGCEFFFLNKISQPL